MSPNRLLLFLAGALCLLSSCQSSKIAYGNSYYFKQSPRHSRASIPPIETVGFEASAAPTVSNLTKPTILPKHPSLLVHSESEQRNVDNTYTVSEKKALRQERRAKRKYFRMAIKEFFKNKKDTQSQQEVTGLYKAAIIVAAAGAVMLVVGILASGAFLTTLGGIFLAVGVVLILLKVL